MMKMEAYKMAFPLNLLILFLMFFNFISALENSMAESKRAESVHKSNREGKLFSPFSIVNFRNGPCDSSSNVPSRGARREGTCYTSSECSSLGGSALGSCAFGFGVCCLFVSSSSNSVINRNSSYIQNPGFPSPYSDTTSVTYTINKVSTDICQLRLDFETLTLLGVGISAGDGVSTCQDQFDVLVSNSGQRIPTICGENTGQHIFVDLGEGSSDSATLTFAFADNSNKQWDIRVTQYQCGNERIPPNGCLQYHTEISGQIKTFNYDLANDNHLPNQEYSICIKKETDHCCIQYSVCDGEDFGFSLSTDNPSATAPAPTTGAIQDDACVTGNEDYVIIAGSSSVQAVLPGTQLTSKYCGNRFSDIVGSTMNTEIFDCTSPFIVGIVTNNMADPNTAAVSKGLCLEYTQLPCSG